jgi:hypothetical protein
MTDRISLINGRPPANENPDPFEGEIDLTPTCFDGQDKVFHAFLVELFFLSALVYTPLFLRGSAESKKEIRLRRTASSASLR